jgi:hypothetical protein
MISRAIADAARLDLPVVRGTRVPAVIAPILEHHHRAPALWFVAVLVLIGLLYWGWRTGRLGRLRSAARVARLRSELAGVRLRPVALVPTALLVIVVVVLVITGSGSGHS